MTEILHAWALAPAALGTCCIAADRRRARAPELAASVLMVLAMADAAFGLGLLSPVLWASLLVVAAMGIAALRSGRREIAPEDVPARPAIGMTVHSGLGLVITGGLMLAMVPGVGAAARVSVHHTAIPGSLVAALVATSVGYALVSLGAAVRARCPVLDRVQLVAMGASTLAMSLALTG